MLEQHAILSASGSHRWLNCTPSARLEQQFEDTTGDAAKEGTAAHALAEYKLKRALKKRAKRPISVYEDEEMDLLTDDYASFVLEKYEEAKQNGNLSDILIEQRLDFSGYVPDGFGTGDAIVISNKTLNVIDFKYGKGVLVDAKNNPQMMLYAAGALLEFGMLYEIAKIEMTIYQPRRENVSSWTISVSELCNWAEFYLKPRAELAFKGEGKYVSGDWCRFCKASNVCRARADANLQLAKYEFAQPPLLTDEDIECILPQIADLTKWADCVFSYAQAKAINEGKKWTGFKVVEGRSNRKYSDESEVVKAVTNAGYTDIYKKSLINLTEMEKLMGKEEFKNVLGDFITKPQGKLTLVPDSDKRQAIETINDDFNKEI